MRLTTTLVVCCLMPCLLLSQKPKGVIFVCATDQPGIHFRNMDTRSSTPVRLSLISQTLNAYLAEGEDTDALYAYCLAQNAFSDVSYDMPVISRKRPNDNRLNEQYALATIQAFDAWDLTTGGTDFAGRDIVIGLIDDGFETTHEDLTDNWYVNPDEIAGDGIDNDGNGYKDDKNGWNQKKNTGIHDVASHGTNVVGVFGARGNNGKGISGVNWNVRILPVTIGTFVSDVVKGLEYLLSERKIYNSTQGLKGSNVQVINYSGGLPKAFASNQPVWCALYDKMGEEGILNVGATTNDGINVEEEGDLPSLCPSPYLLVVNSTDESDVLDAVTGYGSTSVDLAAPGDRILTCDTKTKGLYKTVSGTSLSAPMVAGAAALIHSIKCDAFHQEVKGDPANVVLRIKEFLMACSDKLPSLNGKTVSEGRLNIYESLQCAIDEYCKKEVAPTGPLSVVSVTVFHDNIEVGYLSPNQKDITVKIYDSIGKECYSTQVTPPVLGEKSITLPVGASDLPGLFYFISLISEDGLASKGFTVQNTR